MSRPSFAITAEEPGADLAGETAAALAASSMFLSEFTVYLSLEQFCSFLSYLWKNQERILTSTQGLNFTGGFTLIGHWPNTQFLE